MSAMYYEDFEVGQEYVTSGRTITESDVVQFAALSGDWNALHTNEEYSKENQFGQRIAHGLFGVSLMEGMKYRMGHFDGTAIASLGWTIKFIRPMFIGDTVRVKVRIAAMRESKKRDRGVMDEEVLLVNQHDEVITEAQHGVLLLRRPEK